MDIASPIGKIDTFLIELNDALEQADIVALKALFAPECYWRDLVAFTWNIKTIEGRDAIGDMVQAVLGDVHPRNWQVDGEAT